MVVIFLVIIILGLCYTLHTTPFKSSFKVNDIIYTHYQGLDLVGVITEINGDLLSMKITHITIHYEKSEFVFIIHKSVAKVIK